MGQFTLNSVITNYIVTYMLYTYIVVKYCWTRVKGQKKLLSAVRGDGCLLIKY